MTRTRPAPTARRPLTILLAAPLLLMMIAAAAGGGCGAKPRAITVMTYNIHHAAGTDGKLDLARIADVIRRSDADLVALQEVDGGTRRAGGMMQAAALGRMLNMHHAYGPAMRFDGGEYGNAILSRHRIISSKTVALPHTPGRQREPRAAIAATIELPPRAARADAGAGAGGRIVLISTHFDHTRGSPDRLPQARAVNEQLGGAAADDDDELPAILAGDFNCEPASEPMAELAKRWTLVSDGDAADRGGAAPPSFPSTRPRIKIDHVLVKPRARWRVIDATVVDEPVASDHRPVVVTLQLR